MIIIGREWDKLKKIIIFLLFVVLIHSVHYDLTNGSLHVFEQKQSSTTEHTQPYRIVVVPPGGTVLSIVKQLHTEKITVSDAQIKRDFETLNNGIKPDAISAHQKYKFPIYE